MLWFKHDTNTLRNLKIRKVIRIHGAIGVAIWWAVLEQLYEAEGNFQILATDLWLESIADDLKLSDDRTLNRVLDTFSDIGLIDSQLWQGEKIVYCHSIAERGDAYVAQRLKATTKKQKQRAKKAVVPTLSPGDKALVPGDKKGTRGQMPIVPLSDLDLDLDQELDLDPDLDPDLDNQYLERKKESEKTEKTENQESLSPEKTRGSGSAAKMTSNWTARAKAPKLRYPELLEHGLAWIMNGSGYTDFDDRMLAVVSKHLTKYELPNGSADVKRCIGNKIRGGDFGWLTLMAQEALGTEETSEGNVTTAIVKQLTRLKMSGALPDDWFQKTGKSTVADLTTTQAAEYLNHLKALVGEPDHAC